MTIYVSQIGVDESQKPESRGPEAAGGPRWGPGAMPQVRSGGKDPEPEDFFSKSLV